jgi:hypothetical protein
MLGVGISTEVTEKALPAGSLISDDASETLAYETLALPQTTNSWFSFPMHGLLSAIWLMTTIEVTSTTACPSQTDIQEKLVPLLPTEISNAPDRADLQPLPGTRDLRLRLIRADGELIGLQDLPSSDRCDDLARKVAVLLASWESNPEPGIPSLAMKPAPASITREKPRQQSLWDIQVGASAGLVAIGGLAAAGRIDGSLARAQSHWQIRMGFMTQTERNTTLSETLLNKRRVAWRHNLASLGVAWRTLDPTWLFSGDLSPMLGFASLTGDGFTEDYPSQHSLEYGVEVGLRLGWRRKWLLVFTDVRGDFWLNRQKVSADGLPSTITLDPWDLMIGLGASVRFFL